MFRHGFWLKLTFPCMFGNGGEPTPQMLFWFVFFAKCFLTQTSVIHVWVDPRLIHVWSTFDPWLIHVWSTVDPCLIHVWSTFDPCLIHVWSMFVPREQSVFWSRRLLAFSTACVLGLIYDDEGLQAAPNEAQSNWANEAWMQTPSNNNIIKIQSAIKSKTKSHQKQGLRRRPEHQLGCRQKKDQDGKERCKPTSKIEQDIAKKTKGSTSKIEPSWWMSAKPADSGPWLSKNSSWTEMTDLRWPAKKRGMLAVVSCSRDNRWTQCFGHFNHHVFCTCVT